MKRLYRVLAGMMVLALALSACGSDEDEGQDQPVTPTRAPDTATPEVSEVPAVMAVTEAPLLSLNVVGDTEEGVVALPPQTVAPGEGTIRVNITMPDGYKFNGQAPFTLIWPDDTVVQIPADSQEIRIDIPDMPLDVPVTFVEGQTELSAEMTTYWCEAVNETLCFVDRATLTAPITVSAESDTHALTFERALVPPVQ